MQLCLNEIKILMKLDKNCRANGELKLLIIKLRNWYFSAIQEEQPQNGKSSKVQNWNWPVYYGLWPCVWISGVRVMVFNTTFNNISVILWWSVLLVEETGGPGENHRPAASRWPTLSHNVVSSTSRLSGIRTHNINGDRLWLHSW